MLEILAETKDPLRVQPHLKKCFEGISKLHFDSDLVIHGMYSSEGERVFFSLPVDTVEAHGCVEKWLLQVCIGILIHGIFYIVLRKQFEFLISIFMNYKNTSLVFQDIFLTKTQFYILYLYLY